MREAHALFGEAIEVRRDGMRIAIAAEMRADVLGGEPENVGPGLRCLHEGSECQSEDQ